MIRTYVTVLDIFCKFSLLNSDDLFFEKDFILNRETMKTLLVSETSIRTAHMQ